MPSRRGAAAAILLLHVAATTLAGNFTSNSSIVFTANDTIKSCYRNPVLIATGGDLLCFIEERYRGSAWDPASSSHACTDNYGTASHPEPGGHNLGFSRSSDGGRTWSPIVRLAGNLSNLHAVGGTDYTNNAALLMQLPNGAPRLVWQGSTQNNPSRLHHGRIFQRTSDDHGHTWSVPTDLSYASAGRGLAGATPGPGNGVQLPSGRIVFCAWSNNSTEGFGEKGWGEAANFGNLLTYSDDHGASWQATEPIYGRGWNECFLALLPTNTTAGDATASETAAASSSSASSGAEPSTYSLLEV